MGLNRFHSYASKQRKHHGAAFSQAKKSESEIRIQHADGDLPSWLPVRREICLDMLASLQSRLWSAPVSLTDRYTGMQEYILRSSPMLAHQGVPSASFCKLPLGQLFWPRLPVQRLHHPSQHFLHCISRTALPPVYMTSLLL